MARGGSSLVRCARATADQFDNCLNSKPRSTASRASIVNIPAPVDASDPSGRHCRRETPVAHPSWPKPAMEGRNPSAELVAPLVLEMFEERGAQVTLTEARQDRNDELARRLGSAPDLERSAHGGARRDADQQTLF